MMTMSRRDVASSWFRGRPVVLVAPFLEPCGLAAADLIERGRRVGRRAVPVGGTWRTPNRHAQLPDRFTANLRQRTSFFRQHQLVTRVRVPLSLGPGAKTQYESCPSAFRVVTTHP